MTALAIKTALVLVVTVAVVAAMRATALLLGVDLLDVFVATAVARWMWQAESEADRSLREGRAETP